MRINRIVCLAAALGGVFAAGCGDGGGASGTNGAAINTVTPGTVYLNRTVSVKVGGSNTNWSPATRIDFGSGTRVDMLTANPSLLQVNLTVDETAATGPRDILADNGSSGLVSLKGVFQVEAPLKVVRVQGTPAQGSIFRARAEQKDLSTPFDTASSGKNVKVTSAAGLSSEVAEVQPYAVDFVGQVDVMVAAGSFETRVSSGVEGAIVTSLAPGALAVKARTPMSLKEGMQTAGTVAAPYESYLYSFAPGAHKLVTVEASAKAAAARPSFSLLPESGKFADEVSFGSSGRIVTETDKPIYIIYWDNSGATGYPFDINITTTSSGELEPNNTCATAQPLSSKKVSLTNLSLRNKADEDWFVLDATAAEVGQLVNVITRPGDDDTDTFVQVYTGSCANPVPLGPPSSDAQYHEDHASAPIAAAGKVYVKVSHSPTGSFRGSLYNLDVQVVRTETEPNNTCAQANAVSALPADFGLMTISSKADQDWFAVTVTAANVGQLLTVTTTPGDENTDTYIEVYSGTCAALTRLGASADSDYFDSLRVGPLAAAGTYYVRISNSPNFTYEGSRYNVNFGLAPPPDAEPNNTCVQASAGGQLGVPLGPLSLPNQTDVDWFAFPAAAADIGKVVHVETNPGADDTDTVVEVFDGTCAALNSLGGTSDDVYYHEDWRSTPITKAGMVYVRVSYSMNGYTSSAYTLTVTYE